jgi:amino acid transporter/mannitol/fructose-specific phosphotransferase system IIA component (Ntr-type)
MFEKKRLKKELNLFDVFALATGATLSGGLFLLPGIASIQAGSLMFLSYLIAAVPLFPAMLSKVELATAMPRSGGVYYFLDRSLGPVFGTIGGIGIWFTLLLKSSFALIGMGAYLSLFVPDLPMTTVAIVIALLLGVVNLFGAKKTGIFQIILVVFLLIVLSIFIIGGIPKVDFTHFNNALSTDFHSVISTAGLVYMSYIGITKVASVSEEIKNPEKNLPWGVFLSFAVIIIIYTAVTFILTGVLSPEQLMGNLTPVATAGEVIFGKIGFVFVSVAALVAFISVANVGTLSASRYPLAMSRDHILPRFFGKINHSGSPVISVITSMAIIIIMLLLLDPLKIAKLASAFQLLVFAFICLAVIIMRESKIQSYDPGFKSPFYPWMQLAGIGSAFWLIIEMGWLPILFSLGLILISFLWYWYYARTRVIRTGAIYHIFERLGRYRYHGLDSELRGILKEKGLRESDPFEEIVTRGLVLDYNEKESFDNVAHKASEWISQFVDKTPVEIKKLFLEGTRMGATPVTHGIALPHLRLNGLSQAEIVIARGKEGIRIKYKDPLRDSDLENETDVHAVFFLVSSEKDPTQHLRILAQIAGRVEEEGFADEWLNAKDDQELKEALIHEDRSLSLLIERENTSKELINMALKNVRFPDGCLVAILRRSGQTIIPKGNTVLAEGDRLTIIGDPSGMAELKKRFREAY